MKSGSPGRRASRLPKASTALSLHRATYSHYVLHCALTLPSPIDRPGRSGTSKPSLGLGLVRGRRAGQDYLCLPHRLISYVCFYFLSNLLTGVVIWAPFLWIDLHLLPRHNIIRCLIATVFLLLAVRPVVYWCLLRDGASPPAGTLLFRGHAEISGDNPLVSEICDILRDVWSKTGDSCADLYSFLQVPRSVTKTQAIAALRHGPMHSLGLRSRAVVVLADDKRRTVYNEVFSDIIGGSCKTYLERLSQLCRKSQVSCG